MINLPIFRKHWEESGAPDDKLTFMSFLSLESFSLLAGLPNIFSVNYLWVVQVNDLRNLKKYSFPFSSQVYSLNIISNNNIILKEHYNIVETSQIIKDIGEWTKEEGLILTNESIWDRRRDLEGFEFKECF